jgi:hypothetical protein
MAAAHHFAQRRERLDVAGWNSLFEKLASAPGPWLCSGTRKQIESYVLARVCCATALKRHS